LTESDENLKMESASGNVEEVKMNSIDREPDSANTAGPALQTDQLEPQIGGDSGEDLPDYREDSPDEFGRLSMELSDANRNLRQREREVGDLTRRWIEMCCDLDRTQDWLVDTQKRLLEVMEERDKYEDERDRLEEDFRRLEADFLNHRGREAALREDVASFQQRLRQTEADLQQAQDREIELAGQLEVEQEDNPLASDLQDELSAHLIVRENQRRTICGSSRKERGDPEG
jgi:chromosome segregation ATPase